MPRTPTPPLFPYTTLFRSNAWHREARQRRLVAELLAEGASVVVDNTNPSPAEDRKSTRLNSSHMSISYAVFCLKKKKNQIGTGRRAMQRSLRLSDYV